LIHDTNTAPIAMQAIAGHAAIRLFLEPPEDLAVRTYSDPRLDVWLSNIAQSRSQHFKKAVDRTGLPWDAPNAGRKSLTDLAANSPEM
jgi:hypothetical protein